MRVRVLFASAAIAALCTLSTQAIAQATGSVCTDGSTSAATGRGACSGHGGVDAKATAAANKPASKSKTKVACTDGTMSKGGRGACSSHGGIAAAGATAAPSPAPAPTPAPATPAARPPVATAAAPAPTPSADRVRATTPSPSNATGGSGKPEDNDPTGAIAKCKDGMYSHSAHRSGSCSGHGGVAQWLTK
jgi:hypothetical protein